MKDGINDYVVSGKHNAVNPEPAGTKAAALYRRTVGSGETATIRLRLDTMSLANIGDRFKSFDQVMETRKNQSDIFYQSITPEHLSEDEGLVMRQALSGMLCVSDHLKT